ncbi:MAG: TonB family protein, partial [Verrucomicrobiota bacterium]
ELPTEAPEPQDSAPSEPDLPSIETPDIPNTPAVDVPELDIPEPEPTPPPPAVEPTPTPPEPKPQPTQQITAEEFFRQHGQPEPRQQRPAQPTPAPQIKVNTRDALNRLLDDGARNRIQQASPAEQQALLNFIARLRRQIEIAWTKPEALEGSEVFAVVQVTVQKDGTLNPVVLITPSGSQLFDQSIIRAVRSTRKIGGAPTGRVEKVNYTFRMREV